mgnify:FL=1
MAGQAQTPRRQQTWPIVVGSALLILAVAFTVNYLLTHGPASLGTVKRFYDTASQGRYQKAYSEFHALLQDQQSFEEFQRLASSHSSWFEASYRLWATTEDGDLATVEGKITTKDGELLVARFRLQREKQGWRITGYRIISGDGTAIQAGAVP